MIRHDELSKPVYEKLKEMILSQELKSGEKIVQEKIAEMLGVSRTPLLKALQMLENEYLVESIPRRGMIVRQLDLKEMIDVYSCREAIEGMAARTLAKNGDSGVIERLRACFEDYRNKSSIDAGLYAKSDEVFHKLLVQLTGNKPLDKIYIFGNIHSRVVGLGLLRQPKDTLEEHFGIINAIEGRDADQAEAFIRSHIRKSQQLLKDKFRNQIKKQNK